LEIPGAGAAEKAAKLTSKLQEEFKDTVSELTLEINSGTPNIKLRSFKLNIPGKFVI